MLITGNIELRNALYLRVVNLNWCSYLVTNGTAQYKVIDVPENDQYNLANQSDCDPKVKNTLVQYSRVT